MTEGTWRIVEGADGTDDLYLFRKDGAYAWFSLEGDDGALLLHKPREGIEAILANPPKTYLTREWEKLSLALAEFLRGSPSEGKEP